MRKETWYRHLECRIALIFLVITLSSCFVNYTKDKVIDHYRDKAKVKANTWVKDLKGVGQVRMKAALHAAIEPLAQRSKGKIGLSVAELQAALVAASPKVADALIDASEPMLVGLQSDVRVSLNSMINAVKSDVEKRIVEIQKQDAKNEYDSSRLRVDAEYEQQLSVERGRLLVEARSIYDDAQQAAAAARDTCATSATEAAQIQVCEATYRIQVDAALKAAQAAAASGVGAAKSRLEKDKEQELAQAINAASSMAETLAEARRKNLAEWVRVQLDKQLELTITAEMKVAISKTANELSLRIAQLPPVSVNTASAERLIDSILAGCDEKIDDFLGGLQGELSESVNSQIDRVAETLKQDTDKLFPIRR